MPKSKIRRLRARGRKPHPAYRSRRRSRRHESKGSRSAAWSSYQHQKSIDVVGLRCEAGTRLRAGFVPSHNAPAGRASQKCGRNRPRRDQPPRASHGMGDRQPALRPHPPPMGPGMHTRRLERRRGGGDCGRNDSRRAWAATAAVPSEVSAHFSGIYGLKPTPRRIPATGHFPPPAGALAQIGVVGPMARTVAELKALLEVMQSRRR